MNGENTKPTNSRMKQNMPKNQKTNGEKMRVRFQSTGYRRFRSNAKLRVNKKKACLKNVAEYVCSQKFNTLFGFR